MTGRLIRTEDGAAAVPKWSIVEGDREWWIVGYGNRFDGARIGDTLTHLAVPVEVLQRHEAEVAADVAWMRRANFLALPGNVEGRHRELWPEVLATEVVEETDDEVDPWALLKAIVRPLDKEGKWAMSGAAPEIAAARAALDARGGAS